jgi:Spy/CpxP family protein refolding chaperone
MRTKTIAVVTLVGLLTAGLATLALARGGRHGHGFGWQPGAWGFGHHHESTLEHMADRLDLRQEQRQQVFAVLDKVRPSMRELRSTFAEQRRAFGNLRPTAANYHTRLTELGTEVGKLASQAVVLLGETRAEIAALLTEEQREQAQQMFQAHRKHHYRNHR